MAVAVASFCCGRYAHTSFAVSSSAEEPADISPVHSSFAARCRLRRVLTCVSVSKREKLLEQVLSGRADANLRFEDLRALLLALGFEERTRGSHHVFSKMGVDEQVNLQRDGAKAKPYQVKQVRAVVLRYHLQEN
jgi:hypothetical protein